MAVADKKGEGSSGDGEEGVSSEARFCRAVMNLEWRLLFDHVCEKL